MSQASNDHKYNYCFVIVLMTPDEQIYLLREQLRQAEEQYMRLWNQHKLLRLSYRFLKNEKRDQDILTPSYLSDNFQAFLYGSGRGLSLEFQKPKRRKKVKMHEPVGKPGKTNKSHANSLNLNDLSRLLSCNDACKNVITGQSEITE